MSLLNHGVPVTLTLPTGINATPLRVLKHRNGLVMCRYIPKPDALPLHIVLPAEWLNIVSPPPIYKPVYDPYFFKVRFLVKPDASTLELCHRYWQLNQNFEFLHHMDQLSSDYKMLKKDIHALVEKTSAFDVICEECFTAFMTFHKRDKVTYDEFYQFMCGAPYICETCQTNWDMDEPAPDASAS